MLELEPYHNETYAQLDLARIAQPPSMYNVYVRMSEVGIYFVVGRGLS